MKSTNLYKFNKLVLFSFVIFLFIRPSYTKDFTIIGTIHGDHGHYPLYNFETLRIVLNKLEPDLLLIEEDPLTYHDKLYSKLSEEEYEKIRPTEIKKVIMPFATEKNIQVIPTDFRVNYDKHKKELDLNIDKKNIGYKSVTSQYLSIFMLDTLSYSIYDFHKDKTLHIIASYFNFLSKHHDYQDYYRVWAERQKNINTNIVKELNSKKYKRAIIIYGISHVPEIIEATKNIKKAKYIPISELLNNVDKSINSKMLIKIDSFFN